ncbi:uncharacterized protein LOC131670597 isoform X2 [Phymastichus coffea]|uniref:uncharacterized protein LOC131670597 isoform X2 n=1 Tax=Phymastichus coffea TaxID=108790 RepID=UPI00273CC359|nr:uncharacterized protein LOC131670597 isoform X2 [Phymastichus coffea]
MADQSDRSHLPPGWECRYDGRSGRAYFINHFNRSTTWEDPRLRYWQYAQYIQSQNSTTPSSGTTDHPSESIPLQDLKTPLSTTRSVSGLTNRLGDMTIGSPTPTRTLETSLIVNDDVEIHVAKLSAMFPTVSETHIRLLLKKYHNRPALVVSALQIEKNPLCQPGPCTPIGVHSSYAIQPKWRLSPAIHAALTLSPPRGILPAPHSPKMKLRYLKSLFPKADEYIILDALEQCDNSIQKTAENLMELGYEKRNPLAMAKSPIKKKEEDEGKIIEITPPAPTPPPRMKTLEEKNKMKKRLMNKFKEVPEKVILLAMDSVDYDEARAAHILDIMVAEEAIKPLNTSSSQSSSKSDDKKDSPPVTEALKFSASPIKRVSNKDTDPEKSKRPKNKTEVPKVSRGTSTAEDSDYKSKYVSRPVGPNPDLPKGANNDLLLPDYAPWSGPDPTLLSKISVRNSSTGKIVNLAKGSSHLARGANTDLRKGPMRGLAQGSIYSQRNSTNAESRGK